MCDRTCVRICAGMYGRMCGGMRGRIRRRVCVQMFGRMRGRMYGRMYGGKFGGMRGRISAAEQARSDMRGGIRAREYVRGNMCDGTCAAAFLPINLRQKKVPMRFLIPGLHQVPMRFLPYIYRSPKKSLNIENPNEPPVPPGGIAVKDRFASRRLDIWVRIYEADSRTGRWKFKLSAQTISYTPSARF